MGQTSSLLINFIAIAISAKHLGVESFGLFSYLVAIVGIVSKIIDFGFGPIVLREISKNFLNVNLINSTMTMRLIFSAITFLLMNLVLLAFQFTELEIILTNVLLLNIFFSSKFQNFRELFELPFKSKLMMHIPMVILFFDNNVEEKLKVAIDKGVNHYIQKLQELYNRDVVELENSDNLLDNSDLMIYIIEDLREGLRFFEELFKHKNLSNSTKDFERLNKNLQHRITKILSE